MGDGFSFLPEDADAENIILSIAVPKERMERLKSWDSFTSELAYFSSLIYSKFNDDFDFIFFALDMERDDEVISSLGFYGVNLGISNDIEGLGIDIYSYARYWGSSGKLKSIMYFPYDNAILAGPTLHELSHNWAAYACPTFDLDGEPYDDGHWGVSNAGGQLGGFKYIRLAEENIDGLGTNKYQASMDAEIKRDGSFANGGFGEYANGGNGLPYSDIELYLMGMVSADELRAKNFRLDIYKENSWDESYRDGYFYSNPNSIISYSIDDLIALNGPRVPDSKSAQKQFKVLTAVLTEGGAESYMQEIARNVKWFSGPADDDTYPPKYYNFSRATNGAGSLAASNIKSSLKR